MNNQYSNLSEKQKICQILDGEVITIEMNPKTNVFLVKCNAWTEEERSRKGKYILIDTATIGDELKLIDKLEKVAGITPNDLSLIIITHAHFDHAGCVWYFKKHYPHIKVAVPALEADRFRLGDPAPSVPTGLAARILKIRGNRKELKKIEPDILFHGGESLEEFGVHAQVLQLKGHTEGGISIVLNNKKAAIINDLMGGGFLKYGKPAYHFFLYDRIEILKNIKMLYEEGFEAFLVTHGYAFTRKPLKDWLEKELSKHHLNTV
ncbi:hypothetical protein C9374_013978 [Naegleria lovaniensis]|uniref:Metallo-beta-lactamase domain-containing protein n=1 Tax=Naegleria lovaniensis TaxID=51637 RepID=A0AA88GZS8_NAELO|nr:uncharacterized protein C9374_013978 [Naegleria lovaniensis]KAG2389418.1 hypothetical protein C9374_013978 [Naegleria lovaniensis]